MESSDTARPASTPDGDGKESAIARARARSIGDKVRCITCANQSITDSNAPIAIEMRTFLRQHLAARPADADDAALDALLAAYPEHGEKILYEPRAAVAFWTVAAVPALAGVAGLAWWAARRPRLTRNVAPAVVSGMPLLAHERAAMAELFRSTAQR